MFRTDLILQASRLPDVWTVWEPLVWDSGANTAIVVPKGFVTDLASVPRFLRDRKAFDVNGKSRRPAVLHDFLYATGMGNKHEADLLFKDALLSEGVPEWNAWLFYQAVNWFGYSAYNTHARRRAALRAQ